MINNNRKKSSKREGREYLVRIIMPLLLIENKENIVDKNDVQCDC